MRFSQFNIYTSNDVGSPTLNGSTGSLINVLNWCLVSGSSNPAGWSLEINSTSASVYRQPSGSRCYFNVRDDAVVTSKEARINGFESVTSFNTGSGRFPSLAQGIGSQGYLCVKKSDVTTDLERNWICMADAYTIYMFVKYDNSAYTSFMFGDIYSFLPKKDNYTCMIIGLTGENAGLSDNFVSVPTNINAGVAGHYIQRNFTGNPIVGSTLVGKSNDAAKSGGSTNITGNAGYPNFTDNSISLTNLCVHEPTNSNLRGKLRGMYANNHPATNYVDGDIFEGTNESAKRVFMIVKHNIASIVTMEISATLETND